MGRKGTSSSGFTTGKRRRVTGLPLYRCICLYDAKYLPDAYWNNGGAVYVRKLSMNAEQQLLAFKVLPSIKRGQRNPPPNIQRRSHPYALISRPQVASAHNNRVFSTDSGTQEEAKGKEGRWRREEEELERGVECLNQSGLMISTAPKEPRCDYLVCLPRGLDYFQVTSLSRPNSG